MSTPHGSNGDTSTDAPPANKEAELGLLRSLLAIPEAMGYPEVSLVRQGDFFDLDRGVIYRHLTEAWRDGHSPEAVHARMVAAGDFTDDVRAAFLEMLRDEVTGNDVRYFAGLVKEESDRRTLRRVGQRIMREVADGMPPDDILGAAENELANLKGGNLQDVIRAGLQEAAAEVDAENDAARHRFMQGELLQELAQLHLKRSDPKDIDHQLRLYLAEAKDFHRNQGPQSMASVIEQKPDLRPVVIGGFARVAEVVNIVAPSKRGKSWLVLMLALCVATGKRLFDLFGIDPGKCLIIDNELHAETSAYRVKAVAKAMGLDLGEYGDNLWIDNVRGRGLDINGLVNYLAAFEPGQFSVIVLDALYRFYPKGFEENSNADMTWLYNVLDGLANRLQCVIVCIVHSSKGDQSEKRITDVGSGAGALARAPDTHAAIREHEEPGCVVLEYTNRSFAPGPPVCLRWKWPLWVRDDTLDPSKLLKPGKRKDKQPETVWTADRFVHSFCTAEPKARAILADDAATVGIKSSRKVGELLNAAVARGLLHEWPTGDGRQPAFATVAPPAAPAKPAKRKRKGAKS